MTPWERRLSDLWLLLERCHSTYMEPELFRLNTNQFLQTSRTVTFIIQKHKAEIPNFEDWYSPVVSEWAADSVMGWAKDSRNKIEKEGDLDLHSTLELTLFFSYICEHDFKIATDRSQLFRAGTKRLIRFAQKNIPSHTIDTAAIKIERRWVANTLPNWELLHALGYVYSTMYSTCQKLASHLGSPMDTRIPDPTSLLSAREIVRHVRYLKLSDLNTHYQHMTRVKADPDYRPPAAMEEATSQMRRSFADANTPEKMLHVLADMALSTFSHYGNHVPMFWLFDRNMKPVDFTSGAFRDQVDKYIFWRNLADRAVICKATAVAAIGEAWIRDSRQYYSVPTRRLPIIGERLFVNMLDNTGAFKSINWDIVRPDQSSKPTLVRTTDDDEKVPFVFAPIIRAFGLPYPPHFDDIPPPPEGLRRRLGRLASSRRMAE